MKNVSVSLIFILIVTSLVFSQTTPFIDSKFERYLVNELSGDMAYDNMRWLAHWHRETGSTDYHKAALFIEEKAREYGFEDVQLIRQKWDRPSYQAEFGELWIVKPEEIKLGSYTDYPLAVSMFSRTTHVQTELIYVGEGVTDADYQGIDVAGKIVLTSSHPAGVMSPAVWNRGALGIVSYYYHTFPRTSDVVERPDQVAWTRIPFQSTDGEKEGTFAFMVSPRKGEMLIFWHPWVPIKNSPIPSPFFPIVETKRIYRGCLGLVSGQCRIRGRSCTFCRGLHAGSSTDRKRCPHRQEMCS